MTKILATPDLARSLRRLVDMRDAAPQGVDGISEFPQSIAEFIRIKDDPLFAVGTNDVVVTLEPTERLLELVNAATGEGKLQSINAG